MAPPDPALADAGYRVRRARPARLRPLEPRPEAIEDYDIQHLTDDLIGILDDLGEEKAVFVGHDWGSMVVWQLSLLAPERVAGVVGMSVPFLRGAGAAGQMMRKVFADNFFYIVYFQEPGWPTPSSARPGTTMRRMLCGLTRPNGRRDGPDRRSPPTGAASSTACPSPTGCPTGSRRPELDHYVAEFTRTGFTGGINWYRNFDRNWELTPQLAGVKVAVPSLFIGGSADPVLMMSPPAVMDGWLDGPPRHVLVDGAGHWVQQEKPDEVNAALVAFVGAVGPGGKH